MINASMYRQPPRQQGPPGFSPTASAPPNLFGGGQQGQPQQRGGITPNPNPHAGLMVPQPFNPQGAGNGQQIYNPALQSGPPNQNPGLGSPVLFPQGGGNQMGGGAGQVSSGGGTNTSSYNQSYNPGQPQAGNPFQQLQQGQDRANAANEQRYQQLLQSNQQGGQQALGDMNQSFAGLGGIPGHTAQNMFGALNQNRQNVQGMLGQNQAQQVGFANQAYGNLANQAGQQGQQQQNFLAQGYGGLQNQAGQNRNAQMNFLQNSYGQLGNTAGQSGGQQMGFLNAQDQRQQSILGGFSDAERQREERSRQQQLAQVQQDMLSRGIASTTVDQALNRGINDDSALRQSAITDRFLGRSLGVADAYAGRGLGVLANQGQQQFAAGQGYAGAGGAALGDYNQASLGLGQSGVNAQYGAMANAGSNQLNLGAQGAGTAYGAIADTNRAGVSAEQGAGTAALGIYGNQGQQELGIGQQYTQTRGNELNQLRQEQQGIIERRTDSFDPNMYLQMLAQGGGQRSFAPPSYNGGRGQMGHIAGGEGDFTGFSGGDAYGGAGYGNPNSSYDPYSQQQPLNPYVNDFQSPQGGPQGDPYNDPSQSWRLGYASPGWGIPGR